MKNIRNILAKGVFMLLVSLLAMACTEKSDWGIDASYSRPFGTNLGRYMALAAPWMMCAP